MTSRTISRSLRLAGLILVASLSPAPLASASTSSCDGSRAEVVVKVAPGRTVEEVIAAYPVERGAPLLASHNLFKLRSTDPSYCGSYAWSDTLADQVEDHPAVVYAESEVRSDLSDGRFHAWPDGDPDDAGTDPAAWSNQLAASQLRLVDAHRITRGARTVVAVLDTGVDETHPALSGRLEGGYDYVDDDAVPGEVTNAVDDDADGAVDESYGHGTFVSGTVALVAPAAAIIPMRTLDSDGRGNALVVAEAIADAVAAGADVINLAFGSPYKPVSPVLEEAIKTARKRGVLVAASAGNEGTRAASYPAALGDVIGVGAQTVDRKRLAYFSNRGSWVDVAAPGTAIVGPYPGGRYAKWSGTSVAAPLVSGQAALVTAARPTLPVDKVVDAIVKSTTLVKPLDSDPHYSINIAKSLTQPV